jgi:ribosome-associated protein
MEDMLAKDDAATPETVAQALTELLKEHNGQDVVLLDLRGRNAWTDFFVIATVTSSTHADALIRHVKDYCGERDIELRPHRRPRAVAADQGPAASEYGLWQLIDLGSIVVHLMDKKAREFYNLDTLWADWR